MTFNKTATAIIVASVFSLPLTLAQANPTEIQSQGEVWFNDQDNTTLTANITSKNQTFGDYLNFGNKNANVIDKTFTLNLNVKDSQLKLGQKIKLRTNYIKVPRKQYSPLARPDAYKYNLNFTNSTLEGDIVNFYKGNSGEGFGTNYPQSPESVWIVSAKGNDTTVTFDNQSTWVGNLYQEQPDISKLPHYTDFDPIYGEENQTFNNTVTLKNGSSWTGSILNKSQGTNKVTIDTNSQWTVNNTSNVNTLTSTGKVIVDAAILDFQEGNSSVDHIELKHPDSHIQVSEGANVTLKDVKVSNATAQGHIDFRSLDNNSLKVDAADKPLNIVVDKDVNDKYGLDKTLEKLDTQLTTGKDVTGNFTVEQSVIGDGATGTLANDKLTVTGTTKNTNLVVTSELVAIQMMQWRAEADDMNQRMGELRDSTDANGLWVRTYGGKSEATKVDNEFIGFQFGYDHNVASGANQQFVGGAISYTKGDANFSTGTGDNDTFAFTGYSTWLLDSGSYVDFSAKYGKLNSDFDIKTGLGKLNGDYSTHALAMGVEVGHRFPVANLFYVEPQMAFTASHIFAEDFGAGQGVTIEQDSINSYVARAGLAAGIKCPDNKGSVWMKASYLYDFDGETTTTAKKGAMTNQFDQDFGGGWYELGLGASVNFTKNLHGYADFEYASGAEIETPYKWNVGVRYTY